MIRTALDNPYLVIVGALAISVLGAFSYTKIPAELLPQFETSAVQIVCFYPGMPPEVLEKDIMSRLQRWTGQSVGIEHQEAKAMQGVCVVKDFFVEGVSMDTAMSQVTAYAMSDMFYLPPGTIPPMTMPFDPTANVPLCLVVVSNEQMDEQELYDIAYYKLRNKLQSIQGVIAPAVYGGKLRRVLAYVYPEKLEALGLSLMDVQRALLRQNVLIPAGSIKAGDRELQIFTNANVEHWEELNDTPIKEIPGKDPVRMRNIGYVNGKASQIQSNIVRVNGSRKAYIPIYRQPGANTIQIVKQIKKQLRDIELKLKVERAEDPKMKNLVLSVAMDQSVGVEESNRALQIAATLGAVLAGLVVLVFLRSIRYTLVIIMAIPLAILAAIFAMYFTGDTLNAMTLGGLALAIGILVDQSIVVLENIVIGASAGSFEGGPSSNLDNQGGRSDLDVLAVWELKNLGYGNLQMRRKRASQLRQTELATEFLEDKIVADVITAAADVASYRRQIDAAEEGLTAAKQSYQANLDRIRDAVGLPLELLQAIRARTDAQDAYALTISDYNRAQYRLLHALGQPPLADEIPQP